MGSIKFILRKRDKGKEGGIIMSMLYHKGTKIYWSTGLRLTEEDWDGATEKVINPNLDYYNICLRSMSDEFVRLFTLEKFSGFTPDLNRIKRFLVQKFDAELSTRKRLNSDPYKRALDTKLSAKIDREIPGNSYLRKLLIKEGCTDEIISRFPELLELKKVQVQIRRKINSYVRLQ
jgi:hypothetical protein